MMNRSDILRVVAEAAAAAVASIATVTVLMLPVFSALQ